MNGFLHEEYLKALAQVDANATGGPWRVALETDGPLAGCPTVLRAWSESAGKRIVTVDSTRPHILGHDNTQAVANVAFIAAARDALPRLLDENRRLRNLLNLSMIGEHDATE